MKQCTMDERRAKLESRRYHLEIMKKDCRGPEWNGEFFYDSIRSARAFVRRQFDEWCAAQSVDFSMNATSWKDAWSYPAILAMVKDEEGSEGAFYVKFADKCNPTKDERIYGMEADFTEEGQKEARASYEAQGDDSAESEIAKEA